MIPTAPFSNASSTCSFPPPNLVYAVFCEIYASKLMIQSYQQAQISVPRQSACCYKTSWPQVPQLLAPLRHHQEANVLQFEVSCRVGDRSALRPMGICRNHAASHRLEPIMPRRRVLDRRPGTFSHCTNVLSHSALCSTRLKAVRKRTNRFPQELQLQLLSLSLPLFRKRMKSLLFVGDGTDLGRERLWFVEWRLINAWLQLQLRFR